MNGHAFSFRGESLTALPSGALWWEAEGLFCVSDLHLGKSARMARRNGMMLPPYDTQDTLIRLADDIARLDPDTVLCLGDSFDDLAAARDLEAEARDRLVAQMAGRRWIWIEGNHDPGPIDLGGTHLAEAHICPLTFRHIANPASAPGEVSGHYHPKARIPTRARTLSRRCFLVDDHRLILPAFGTYTGGLFCDAEELAALMSPGANAIVLPGRGQAPLRVPMPRQSA